MKIRLKLTTPAGATTLFSHSGPVIRIGRDPSCELLLDGEDAGKAASRLHARIELLPNAAQLIDVASANKTLHNSQPVEKPVSLKAGDSIQIGFTGTTMIVQDIDLTPAGPDFLQRIQSPVGLSVCGGVAACVVLLCVVAFWPRKPAVVQPDTPVQQLSQIVTPPLPPPPAVNPNPHEKPVPPVDPQPRLEKSRFMPSVEVKTVGHYLRPPTTRPSVLLQRTGENYPWAVLRSGQTIPTAHSLVSLPGYESFVSLDCGLRLNLWGSLPEFGSPVFESAIMLNAPAAGMEVDLTLDRGRVEIDSASRSAGNARIRIRFLREVWEVVLVEPASKVCVELWQTQSGSSNGEAKRCFGLFTRGKVKVMTGRENLEFSSPARLAWSSTQPGQVFQAKLSEPPAWWDKPPARTPALNDIILSLDDWAVKRLDRSPDVLDTILTVVRESKDRTDRLLGLWFLAALDEVSHLIEFLEDNDSTHADIRNTAMYAMRDWLARNPHQRESLMRFIQQRRGFARVNAALVLSLLVPFSEKACEDPATYQALIGYLDHDKLAVRHLASQHLYAELAPRMPREALQIDYDPTQEAEKRREVVEKWRKLVPAGTLPVPPAKEKGS